MSNKTEAALHSRTLQDELRAAAQESDDYSLLTRAASALDAAERAHLVAWETEDAIAVVWGTHDPHLADEVYREYYESNGFEPGEYPLLAQWRDEAKKKWGRPELRYMEETWPYGAHGDEQVTGWVPYLVLVQ
ncbi:hypothetical protein PTW37_10120 [Arthrobacter agilis]|uniref:hypothetical protein n=1 Tax=Arthrobacter agilis TaxID=37921 RepID=UPI002366C8EE|nr:hypothetical protein [Arthrobacter agilis]WDF32230.1 hypothetical protein PTW37_10120 [Arthrobacter agilis]